MEEVLNGYVTNPNPTPTPVAKLEVVLVVLGTTKHFSKKIFF
jgi:hypothetical protein